MKVAEGSRQNGSVTLGKGMALRVGHRGPYRRFCVERMLPFTGWTPARQRSKARILFEFPCVWNNYLRTEAIKGNPTV